MIVGVCIAGMRKAPIGRKKSIRTSHGDAQILFFASSGASIPQSGRGLLPADFEELSLGNFQEFDGSTEIGSRCFACFRCMG